MSYQVFAGQKEYSSSNAAKAADVAVTWKINGLSPNLWKVTGKESVTTTKVEITTKAATAKALTTA